MEGQFDYVIVGGGCMAVSIALELRRRRMDARIIVIEGSQTNIASNGGSKIIRTPYKIPEYARFAEEAKKKWENEPYLDTYYYRTGWVQIIRGDEYSPFHPDERRVQPGFISRSIESDYPPVIEDEERLWLDEDIGVADAALSVEAVAKQAAALGVVRHKTDVAILLIEENVCVGVQDVNGAITRASTTIVATGPWTPGLLKDSNIHLPDGLFRITATSVAWVELTEREYDRFKSFPIVTTELGEVMRSVQHRFLQITSTDTFDIRHPSNLEEMKVGTQRLDSHRSLLAKVVPEFKDRPLRLALYPELMMRHEDPLVDKIPGIANAFVAAGGSYHCFKFLTVFGGSVVDFVLGGTRQGVSVRWGWDRSEERKSVHSEVLPKG